MADLAKDLFDDYGRPIIVCADPTATTADLSKVTFDEYGRPVKVMAT